MQEQNATVDNFSDRLKLIVKIKFDGKWTRFARKTGIAGGSVNNYLKGISLPGFKQINLICAYVGVNANWLLTGHGKMFHEDGETPVKPAPSPKQGEEEERWWEDVIKTLQRRINELERVAKTPSPFPSSSKNLVSAFWTAIQGLPETQRRELLEAALESLESRTPNDTQAAQRETEDEASDEKN